MAFKRRRRTPFDQQQLARLRPRRSGRSGRLTAPYRRRRMALAVAAVIGVTAIISAIAGGGLPLPPKPGFGRAARAGDPFAYLPSREADFVARATAGSAQVLFTKSPGGALGTAARVAVWRPAIDAATRGTAIDPAVLEALVFVESAGRANVIAGTDAADAGGLTQILASTGQSLLGMHIDLAQSRKLTGKIYRAQAAGRDALVTRLERQRAAIDDRFYPAKALAATVRYLQIAQRRFGRSDLAVVSYHMGIGNLQNVITDYGAGGPVPYAQLYFDSAPSYHASAWRLLSSFGDDSSLYYWRVLGALSIMRRYRTDRTALARLNSLQNSYPSNALVLHPGAGFADPGALDQAYQRRQIVPLPRNSAQLGLRYDPKMGSLASKVGAPRALYRGLRPAALAMLIELSARIRAISGVAAPLTVASTVTDARYESQLGFSDPPSTTGYTFQIDRRYAARAQAAAFQFMLDRLQALNLIAWIRGDKTIEITVASDAAKAIANGP